MKTNPNWTTVPFEAYIFPMKKALIIHSSDCQVELIAESIKERNTEGYSSDVRVWDFINIPPSTAQLRGMKTLHVVDFDFAKQERDDLAEYCEREGIRFIERK